MSNVVVIDDSNFQDHVEPVVDGEQKKMGLIPRNYQSYPVGYSAHAKPLPDELIIPRSEWKDRLEQQKKDRARLIDIRNISGPNGGAIPSRDQNGKGYCHSADTEVLTQNGWTPFPKYDFETPIATVNPLTHKMEFQHPFERHVYEYKGPIIHSTNRRIDFGVTPDHKMYVRKWNERNRCVDDSYSFVKAGDLGWLVGLLHAPSGQIGTKLVKIKVPGDREYDGNDFLALLALVISDGFASSSQHSGNLVSFSCFRKGRLQQQVAELATRLGFKELPSRPGVWNRWGAGALVNWLHENIYCAAERKAQTKCIPLLVKSATPMQIRHFLYFFGDRSYSHQRAYWSTSKRLIDDLQELHLRLGERSSISYSKGKTSVTKEGVEINGGPSWKLLVAEEDSLCLDRKKHIETDNYNGLVYCAGVPNHTLLTRRNGSVLISSNCWAHSSVSAMLLARAVMNEPYVDLSAFAVACIIKHFRDEGGWGAESLEFIAKRGVPTSEFWPQKSMSRSNDNPKTWENAALHKFIDWYDLEPRNLDHFVTACLNNWPIVSDFNWWGHSVCTMCLEEVGESTKDLVSWILNSWGDKWSQNGAGMLKGSKALPDAMLAACVSSASSN